MDDHLRAGERPLGDRRRQRHLAADPRRRVRGRRGRGEHPRRRPRTANYDAVPRVTYTDPQAAAVGALEAEYSATAPLSEVPKTATYTHAYAESNGFLTLLSDGQRLTGAYALGPEAGEWLQQATLAIRARVPLEVLSDTIQPFPSFSGIYDAALKTLRMAIVDMPHPLRPVDAADGEPARGGWSDHDRAQPAAPAGPHQPGTGRADRRPDRRQRRHRAGDRAPGPGRGGRGRPHRPQPRPAQARRRRNWARGARRPSTPPTRRPWRSSSRTCRGRSTT